MREATARRAGPQANAGQEDLRWYQRAVFYEVFVRAFCDTNADGIGDLRGVTRHLDYFKELGVDCLWLMPVYQSPLLDDGYDIADYYQIHPDYGTLEDFKELVAEVHAQGLRIIVDLVLNHTSDQHPWFQQARSSRSSPYRDYYVWSDTNDKYNQARIIFLDTETSNWTWDEQAGQYFWHRFYSSQPDLNFDNPAVQEEIIRVMKFWLDIGVDGFRADAVPYLYEREGTNCENLPETHAYVRHLRRFIDENYPGRILLAEANQWPQDVRAYFGDGDEFHMAFHFPVMPRIFMALAKADRGPIVDILAATPVIPKAAQWCTFLRNHDELTLEMVTPEERQFMWDFYAPMQRMRLNLGIRRRLAPLLGGEQRKVELLNSILFTLPGSPILYYGDEIGMGDLIELEDRDGVRTPMQWDAGRNAGFSGAPGDQLYDPVIDQGEFSYRKVNVTAQRKDPASLWNHLHPMIAIRKTEPAFGQMEYSILPVENQSVLVVERRSGEDKLIALHNLSAQVQELQLAASLWNRKHLNLLLGGRDLPQDFIQTGKLDMNPYEYLWLKIQSEEPH